LSFSDLLSQNRNILPFFGWLQPRKRGHISDSWERPFLLVLVKVFPALGRYGVNGLWRKIAELYAECLVFTVVASPSHINFYQNIFRLLVGGFARVSSGSFLSPQQVELRNGQRREIRQNNLYATFSVPFGAVEFINAELPDCECLQDSALTRIVPADKEIKIPE